MPTEHPTDTGSEWSVLTAALEQERALLTGVCGRLPPHTWNQPLANPRGGNTPLTLIASNILFEAVLIDVTLRELEEVVDPPPHDPTSMPDLMTLYHQRADETWRVLHGHALDDPANGLLPRDVVAPNVRAIVVKIVSMTASAAAVLQFFQMRVDPFEP